MTKIASTWSIPCAVAGNPSIPLFKGRIADGAAQAMAATLGSGHLATGPRVREFENALGKFIGNARCVATVDRAAAMTLALRLCGVGAGDEVLLSPLACLATTMPIANLGALPRWCDVDPDTGMLDPGSVVQRVSRRCKAIIHYLWGGDVGPLPALQQLADSLGLPLVVDASGGLGARMGETLVGATSARFTVFSFYAVAHLAAGDGGLLACALEDDAETARALRRFGIQQATFRKPDGDLNPLSDIPVAGYSFAMTDLTASLALAQLPLLPDTLERHRRNAARLDALAAELPALQRLSRAPDAVSAAWVYAVRAGRRDHAIACLHAAGVGCQRLHVRNDAYSCFAGTRLDLPGVDAFDAANLALPCGWWLDEAELLHLETCLRALP